MNNEGVTLVELLVSITILSIVVGAFYSCFVLAAKTNAKAKNNHKATTLAQNLMENIKAEDMDSLLGQIVYPTYTVAEEDGTVRTVQRFRLNSQSGYDIGNVVEFAEADKPYATSADGGITVAYNPTVDTYEFCLRNLKMENTAFDALVTVKASAAVNGAGEEIAKKDMVHIPSMDSNYDAVVANATVYDTEALSYFESKGVYDPYALTNPTIERTITVAVDEAVKISGAIGYEVKATYRYDCADELYEVTDTVYSNDEDMSKPLRNVFLFFKPHFSWVDAGWIEKIVIENPDDYAFDLYMVKQQPTDDTTALGYEKTTHYEVGVYVKEGNMDGQEVSSIDIRTNLGYAFETPTEAMSGRPQARYYFNGVEKSADYESFFDLKALTNQSSATLLFDVNIKIYEGDTARVMKSTGTESYAGESVLVELEGTLRN